MIRSFKHKVCPVGLLSLLLIGPIFAIGSPAAGETASGGAAGQQSGSMQQLPEYLLNLGSYLGYNLNNSSTTTTQTNTLIEDLSKLQERLKYSVSLYLGAINIKTIVEPSSTLSSAWLTSQVNSIFQPSGPSSVATTDQSQQPFISPLIDQKPYQNNPVNQFVLNALTTPDGTYCMEVVKLKLCDSSTANQAGDMISKCCGHKGIYLYQGTIGTNVLGTIPSPGQIYSYYPLYTDLLDQLNGNTLIDPLLYATSTSGNSANASNTTSANTFTSGLPTNTQVQLAEDYIRYASGSVSPSPQTSYETYQKYYSLAVPSDPKTTPPDLSAQKTLSNYIAGLRTFAAQTSVGIGNLYYMFSRRMLNDRNTGTESSSPSSPALDEYNMATRRLFNPDSSSSGCNQAQGSSTAAGNNSGSPAATSGSGGCQWVDQINRASPATVQKEIAVLLSEINYQLYLTRQQQERLLLTNTIMLFQLGHLVEPSPLQAPQQ